jgi:hypothetical protein
MSLGKYDALTVLTYFSGLVSEIHEFIADVFNMPPPMTIFKSLRSAETRQIMEKLMELLVNPEFSALSKFFDIFVKLSDALKLVGPPDTFELPDGSFDVELFEKSLYDTLHSGKFERSNEDYQLTPPWALTFAKEVYEIKYFFPKIYPKLEEDRKARVKNSFLNVKKPEKISKKEKRKLFSMYLSDYSSFLDDCIRFYLYKERGLRYIPPSSHLIAEFF